MRYALAPMFFLSALIGALLVIASASTAHRRHSPIVSAHKARSPQPAPVFEPEPVLATEPILAPAPLAQDAPSARSIFTRDEEAALERAGITLLRRIGPLVRQKPDPLSAQTSPRAPSARRSIFTRAEEATLARAGIALVHLQPL